MASEAVLKYLEDTNRPYSCADVTVNLRGAFSKTVIQKTLDALSEAGKIKCKLYGKQKVYVAIQLGNIDGASDNEDYDVKIKSVTKNLEEDKTTLKTTENSLKMLLATPTSESAKQQIEDITKNVEIIEKKLATLRDSVEVLSPEEKKSILNQHDTYLREYRKRKRICSEMIDSLLEGYPKSKKNFLDELCIETDEMVHFQLTSQ